MRWVKTRQVLSLNCQSRSNDKETSFQKSVETKTGNWTESTDVMLPLRNTDLSEETITHQSFFQKEKGSFNS